MDVVYIRTKGGEGSGWFSPPRGSHTGDAHREAGSGTTLSAAGQAALDRGKQAYKTRIPGVERYVQGEFSIDAIWKRMNPYASISQATTNRMTGRTDYTRRDQAITDLYDMAMAELGARIEAGQDVPAPSSIAAMVEEYVP